MYNLLGHAKMIADTVRIDAYAQALRQVVRPGSVVVDLGSGTGIFALLACRFGARRVYAIEPDDIIQVAREIAAANHCAERIEFIQELSNRVTLPERADIVVSDLRGVLPLFEHHIPLIVDARKRFLAPGGTLIPQRDTIWAVPVEAPELYHVVAGAGEGSPDGFDLGWIGRLATNIWQKARLSPGQLLAEPQCWATLDYNIEDNPDIRAEVEWRMARRAIGHGFVAWFNTILVDGVQLSNAPDAAETIYGSAFFPWSEPVTLEVGDRVSLQLDAHLVGADYVWCWATRIFHPDHPGQSKATFEQSTFYGTPLAMAHLRKRAADHCPTLEEDGRIDQFVLGLMDGRNSLGEIARQLAERFPDRFLRWEDALTRVGELSQKYSR